MRVVFFGDVVGRPGRRGVGIILRMLRRQMTLDFVVANGENAAGGKGLDPGAADELFDAGVDVVTTGNHVWQHRELVAYMQENERVLRPLNFAPTVPGRGWVTRPAHDGTSVAVVNLIGRAFMAPADCPFRSVDAVITTVKDTATIVLVDMHAEATSEKVGMARFLDGRVSAVVGSHTHVQTSDEAVSSRGTASITDAGMCGPEDSILGMRTDRVIARFLDQMPVRFDVASGAVSVQGVVIDVDAATGRARTISRVRERVTA